MAKQVQLKAKTRTGIGRSLAKQLRAQGVVPGIIYGKHAPPTNLAIVMKDLENLLHHATGENVLVDLQVEDSGKATNRLALIQEVQHHPWNDIILHVDFHEVSATEKLRTAVSVRAVGEPAGVKTGGGVLESILRELRVECLPKDLPDVIEINVEALEIGQAIHVRDIKPPAGVTVLDDKDQTVFIVAAPIAEEEAVASTELVEPEVIGAKKEEGEEGAGEGEKPKAGAKPEAGKAEAGKGDAKAPAAGGKGEAKPAAGAAKPAAGAKPEAKK